MNSKRTGCVEGIDSWFRHAGWEALRRGALWLVMLLLLPAVTLADRYWIGSGGNWNATANWSTTSGGAGGASLPGTANIAIFDGNSGDCTINQNIDVGGLHLTAAYTGTVTQDDPFTVRVRGSDFQQAAGTFLGGSNVFLGGHFVLEGGNFTAGDGQLIRIPSTNFRVAGASFTAGNSTVEISGGNQEVEALDAATIELFNLLTGNATASTTRNLTLTEDTVVQVAGELILKSNPSRNKNINGPGELWLLGDVDLDDRGYGGTAWLRYRGVGDQTLTGDGGTLGNISIDKPSGTLHLGGDIRIVDGGALEHLTGDVNPHDSYVRFRGTVAVTGSVTLAKVDMGNHTGSGTVTMTLEGESVLTVTNTLTFEGSQASGKTYRLRGGGRVEARGDITFADGNSYATPGDDGWLVINGAGNQLLSGGGGFIPPLIIDKSEGVLSLAGTMTLGEHLTYRGGEIDPQDSILRMFNFGYNDISISNAVPLNLAHVVVGSSRPSSWNNLYLENDSIIKVQNSLTFSNANAGGLTVRYGEIQGRDDLTIFDGGARFRDLGDGTQLILDGDADQTFSVAPGAEQMLGLPIRIDKTDGEVLLNGDLDLSQDGQTLTLNAGTLNLGTNSITSLSASNTELFMQSAATLNVTLTDTDTRLAVSGDAAIDGVLRFFLAPGYMPDIADEIELITAGAPVSGTFAETYGSFMSNDLSYNVLYNDAGNNVKLTEIRPFRGTMFMFR